MFAMARSSTACSTRSSIASSISRRRLTLDAESDFAQGLDVNLLSLIRLLERCRLQQRVPSFGFASSISTFGGALPEVVDDGVAQTPETSYGCHKASPSC